MAKDTTTDPVNPVSEIETLKAQNAQLSAELRQAMGAINELRSDMEQQRQLSQRSTMSTRIEDARRAQQVSADTIAKQSLGRNSGDYGWRIAIKGYKQPLVMWCEKSDPQDAIACFNNRYGTQFDGKKMTIVPINKRPESKLQTVA